MQTAPDRVEEAVRIAAIALVGKPDTLLHALRVGLAGSTDDERVLGFLHDVIEDTTFSADILRFKFGVNMMLALAAITREPGEGYSAYITRVERNQLAKAVKINDLKDNLARPGRNELKERYRRALAQLEGR